MFDLIHLLQPRSSLHGTSRPGSHCLAPWSVLRCLWFVTVCVLAFPGTCHADTFSSLYSFAGPDNGVTPDPGLIQGTDGNLYGTTRFGGLYNEGTVFQITPGGATTTLHSFSAVTTSMHLNADGANPYAGVIQASDGNLYGTTWQGGANGSGTLFQISTNGSSFNVLHSFRLNDGLDPNVLIQGADSNLYGTTALGGAKGNGTLFQISTSGSGFNVLHSFNSFSVTDGGSPSTLIQGTDGNFYGTTEEGGAQGGGTLFQISTSGSGFNILHSFSYSNATGISDPNGLIQGTDGSLYGTTGAGGTQGFGTIFHIGTSGGGFKVLHSFIGTDGADPGGLIQGTDGSLYGTAGVGGTQGQGTIFHIGANGGGFKVLNSFSGTEGTGPTGVIQCKAGNLYGTTATGGANGLGTVFEISADGSGFSVLYTFSGSGGASTPSSLIAGADGNLYGTTSGGGPNGLGTIFEIRADGTGFEVLFTFDGTNGSGPSSLIQGTDGNLYGTAGGGTNRDGILFQINIDGSGFNVLHTFGGSDGVSPNGLIQGADGTLYGVTSQGGANGFGTVFQISTNGASFNVLHSFNGTDGFFPHGRLIQGKDGNLYGTAYNGGANSAGTVFQISTDGSSFNVLHSFVNKTDGANPYAGLCQGMDGNLYGTTALGGANSAGTVFQISTDGSSFNVLNTFDGAGGANPRIGLIQVRDGSLYGTTSEGGANGDGTIFQINTNGGGFNVLHSFDGTDGAYPATGLIQGADANLYATTQSGGDYNLGTLFTVILGTGAPRLTSLSPSSVDAGRSGFTVTVNGSSFGTNSVVQWTQGSTTTPLTTTFVSGSQLKASLPAALIASPGTASVTVANTGGVVSNARPFTILVTNFRLLSATLANTGSGAYTANITLENSGNLIAPNVTITRAILGTTATSTPLPVSLGSVAKHTTITTLLTFPISAGASGTVVTLKVMGAFNGGIFSGSLKVTLP